MGSHVFKISGLTLVVCTLSTLPVQASGFDNLGIGSMDLLFDPAKYALEFGATYQDRNVDYQATNTTRSRDRITDNFPPNVQSVTGGSTKIRATPNVYNYTINAKFDVIDNFSCLARINNPGSILEEAPEDWNGRYSLIKTELTSFGFDTTCAIKIPLQTGQFRVIGGARYIEADISVLKYTHLIGAPFVADINLSGHGYGWRAGLAYEIPEYAIRASLFYDHEIDIKATGDLISSLGPLAAMSDFTMPKGFEFRVQSGIAPKWLAFAGVKWVNWSSLDKLTIEASLDSLAPGVPPIVAERLFNFSDGWTVTAGIGHQLTEKIQVGSSITWDQGIGGSYSDVYQWGVAGSYKFNDSVSLGLGGAIAYKTSAKNELVKSVTDASGLATISEDMFNLSYDASLNFGVGAKLKLTF